MVEMILPHDVAFGSDITPWIKYRLLYGRGVPLGHIGTGVAILARGPIWLYSANMS